MPDTAAARPDASLAALRREAETRRALGPAHVRLAAALIARGERREAGAFLRRAAALPAADIADLEALGFTAFGAGEHEVARLCYQKVSAAAPGDALAWYNFATALRNTGALDQAEEACDRALGLDPLLAQAALLRAHLRTQSETRNHVAALRAVLARTPAAGPAPIFLHYALAKEYEDIGAFDEAMHHYWAGARLRRASLDYDVRSDIAKLRRIREAFGADRLCAAPPLEAEPQHVFIVGLPRSGTTMVERVLTGHPAVASNGETDLLLAALMVGTPPGSADIFDRVAAADPARTAAAYARMAGAEPAPALLLEKLPMNYLYAGAIRLTMPRARTILVRRAPIDNCFAMFSTLFGSGYPFSYDFGDLAAYHGAYRELVAHWEDSLGDQLLVVDYETFVGAPAREGARVAAHCGIGWHDGMAAIENNRSASATASAAQVRRPIYTSAIGRAARFEKHLAPLADRLREAGANGA